MHATEYTFFHPQHGTYRIKEWQKNPYKVIGIGEHKTHMIDEEFLKHPSGSFGIIQFHPKRIREIPEQMMSLDFLINEEIVTLEIEGEMYRAPKPIDIELRKKYKRIDEKMLQILKNEKAFDGYI